MATGFQTDALAINEPSQREMPTVVSLVENQNRYAFYGALETPKDEDVLQIETKDAALWYSSHLPASTQLDL
ncbi:MAG: hypothetical protein ACKO9Q_14655, partial [Pirellula sp.]